MINPVMIYPQALDFFLLSGAVHMIGALDKKLQACETHAINKIIMPSGNVAQAIKGIGAAVKNGGDARTVVYMQISKFA